jgi:hypothetical protein
MKREAASSFLLFTVLRKAGTPPGQSARALGVYTAFGITD